MRKIYKILISVFTILVLMSTIGIAAKPTPTPNPEHVQDARLVTLETNDTIQQTNNTEQQGLINGLINDINVIKIQILSLTDLINSLSNRVTNLENSPGISGYEIVTNSTHFSFLTSEPIDGLTVVAYCPEGKQVISGGGKAELSFLDLRQSYPLKEPDGWSVSFGRDASIYPSEFDVNAYAICANVNN